VVAVSLEDFSEEFIALVFSHNINQNQSLSKNLKKKHMSTTLSLASDKRDGCVSSHSSLNFSLKFD